MTHSGGPPQWEIVRGNTAPTQPNVLAQLSQDGTAGRFPLAIWDGTGIGDGEVSVSFKAVAGSIDQAAGIIWRYQDHDNYYFVWGPLDMKVSRAAKFIRSLSGVTI